MSDAYDRRDVSIVLSGSGKSVRLGSPSKWRRAIQLGDLAPETPVEVTSDGVTVPAIARDVPQLALLFESLGFQPSPDPTEDVRTGATEGENGVDADGGSEDPVLVGTAGVGADADGTPAAYGADVLAATPLAEPSAAPPASATHKPPNTAAIGASVAALLIMAFLGLISVNRQTPDPPVAAPTQVTPSPPIVESEQLELGKVISWSSGDGTPKMYLFRELTLTLSSRAMSDGLTQPVLTIAPPFGPAVEVVGAARMGDAQANLGIVQLDAQSPTPQIYFSSFTGGAHCCTQGQLVVRSSGGFATVPLGDWDLGIKFSDLDGDGVSEILVSDERFLYAFAPYADSATPPKVLKLQGEAVVDVSSAYPAPFREAMDVLLQGCINRSNGACAAYVASAARAGQFPSAWDTMLTHYNSADSWQYPTGCSMAEIQDECPAGSEIRYSSYPEALRAFLIRTGYLKPEGATFVAAPSFDCARADIPNLRLICTTPELAAADNRLAAAYEAAKARSSNPERLRRSQLEWIAARNGGPTEAALILRMYESRISELNGLANE